VVVTVAAANAVTKFTLSRTDIHQNNSTSNTNGNNCGTHRTSDPNSKSNTGDSSTLNRNGVDLRTEIQNTVNNSTSNKNGRSSENQTI